MKPESNKAVLLTTFSAFRHPLKHTYLPQTRKSRVKGEEILKLIYAQHFCNSSWQQSTVNGCTAKRVAGVQQQMTAITTAWLGTLHT